MNEEEIIEDINQLDYTEQDVKRLLIELEKDTGNYSNYDLAMAIIYYKNLHNKEKEKVKRYENELDLDFVDENFVSKDKIKAKIEEIDIEIQCCEYSDDDIEEYKQDMEKEKSRLLRDKRTLQELLEEVSNV